MLVLQPQWAFVSQNGTVFSKQFGNAANKDAQGTKGGTERYNNRATHNALWHTPRPTHSNTINNTQQMETSNKQIFLLILVLL